MRAVSILAVLIAIFAVGCGEQKEADQKKVVKPKVVDAKRTVERSGLRYEVNSEEPFTGMAVGYYSNGQKRGEAEYRDGKLHGKGTEWYENGQKKYEGEFRAGVMISAKSWDENGDPISRE